MALLKKTTVTAERREVERAASRESVVLSLSIVRARARSHPRILLLLLIIPSSPA